MEASLVAGFVALGLCIPLIIVGFYFRFMAIRSFWSRDNRTGDKRPKLPPRDPYHIP